ncbi:hypothetical protein Dsin_013540 [Dipteronia sinensis]|uniref:RNase H type-1 domain-containing protein n=1 Tax=Dipteronia sinensis TaxID=43782 RepID=A0AAE0AL06_9ROSI|nr:hypothetical protein Dsin_013540 [Dipteronia sinensis]
MGQVNVDKNVSQSDQFVEMDLDSSLGSIGQLKDNNRGSNLEVCSKVETDMVSFHRPADRHENVKLEGPGNGQYLSGGLCLFWADSMDVSLMSYSLFHIDVQIVSHRSAQWRMTGFYGHPEASQLHHAWSLLRRLNNVRMLDCMPTIGHVPRSRRFHFEECWAEDEKCAAVIQNSWNSCRNQEDMSGVVTTINQCTEQMSRWYSGNKRGWLKKIQEKQNELLLASSNIEAGSWHRIRNIECELDILLDQEEVYWRQRSRQKWLNSGDKNTKYFHRKASSKRSRNVIRGLFDKLDANLILSLPCSTLPVPDALLWHFDKLGSYSVHSGYHFGCELLSNSSTSGLLNLSESWWKFLWRVKLLVKATSFLEEFRNVNKAGVVDGCVNRLNGVSWCPQDTGFYKLNTDAAVDDVNGKVSCGIIIRDCDGSVMASSVQLISTGFSAQVAEAMAMLRGFIFAYDSGLFPCILESDAKVDGRVGDGGGGAVWEFFRSGLGSWECCAFENGDGGGMVEKMMLVSTVWSGGYEFELM